MKSKETPGTLDSSEIKRLPILPDPEAVRTGLIEKLNTTRIPQLVSKIATLIGEIVKTSGQKLKPETVVGLSEWDDLQIPVDLWETLTALEMVLLRLYVEAHEPKWKFHILEPNGQVRMRIK